MYANRRNFRVLKESGSRNTMVTSDFSPEVEIRPFRACAMHPAIINGTVRSLWTWLWGRYHVPQNAFLVSLCYYTVLYVCYIKVFGVNIITMFYSPGRQQTAQRTRAYGQENYKKRKRNTHCCMTAYKHDIACFLQ